MIELHLQPTPVGRMAMTKVAAGRALVDFDDIEVHATRLAQAARH